MARESFCELMLHVLIMSLVFTLIGKPTALEDHNGLRVKRCIERERNTLLNFKQGLVAVEHGDQLSSWGSAEDKRDCCRWEGVLCNNRTGHVVALDLHADHFDRPILRGKISSSLAELQHLTYLDLSSNDFQESRIPEFVGSLRKLRHLNLEGANFSGKIPHQIGNLTDLLLLDLSFNNVNVDNPEWLWDLRSIRHLDLSWIDLSKINWLQSIYKLPFLTELHLLGCQIPGEISPLLPITNSTHTSLAIIYLSYNNFNSSQSLHWLFNLSASLVDVVISDNKLGGRIPDVFAKMTSLRNLDLRVNLLEGEIPKSMGNMMSLENLHLRGNSLEGEIPESFGNLSHLRSLDLSNNNLTGNLPEVLKKLSGVHVENSIEFLDLSGNQLSGPLPDINRLPSLKELYLSGNQLNESFPKSFRQYSRLVTLDLSDNQITGSLHDLTSFAHLKEFHLSNNHLKGGLTKSVGQLSELKKLDASSNEFEETITEALFTNLSQLRELDLSLNSLILEFRSDWIPPFQLDVIRLERCKLGPDFPKWLQTQNNFSELHIPQAGVSDAVPNWFWNLSPRLMYLNLSANHLSGLLPDLSSKFIEFVRIDLSSNQFDGPLPLFPPKVTSLHLSKNKFSGPISSLCGISGKVFSSLDLSDNLLSGELPDCWMQMEEGFVILNLANNNFSGKIPSSTGFLSQLQSLHMRNNNFIGELPASLKNCTELRILDLGVNKLSGRIPEWIGTFLNKLIVLSLRMNNFYGHIPPSICNLNYIQILDLSQNRISGNLPQCFNNFTSLVQRNSSGGIISTWFATYSGDHIYLGGGHYTDNALVQWKRQETEYRNTLGLLKSIDLSSNHLVGEVPEEIANFRELISLNLSRNILKGRIVAKIGDMKMLESIDLSRNLLFGEIPLGLARLNYLSFLDLSNNNLSGKIPTSTQLQGFDTSVYAGNRELCGLPLPNKCPGDGIAPVPPVLDHGKDNNVEEEEDKLITQGFYVSMVIGFALGFWGIFGTLLIKTSWRHAYFKFLKDMIVGVYVTTAVFMARLKRLHRG